MKIGYRICRSISHRRPAQPTNRRSGLRLGGAVRAYNDWLTETYIVRDPPFKCNAILPMPDLEVDVEELQHANQELGMCGVPFFSGDRRAFESWRQILLEGVCRSGCAWVPCGGPRRRCKRNRSRIICAGVKYAVLDLKQTVIPNPSLRDNSSPGSNHAPHTKRLRRDDS